jgi:predicted DNA-binding protein (MmcQ/YjbR family)
VKAADVEKFLLSLPSVTLSIQWGENRVFKIGGKIFAILGPKGNRLQGLSFKAGQDSFHILTRTKHIIPAPYLARAHWVLLERMDVLGVKELKAYLSRAHAMVAGKLSKKKRAELGIATAMKDEIFDPFA